jgi:drug/metabolite transporter (DMT)-like permease
MDGIGIVAGLFAALFQALSYPASRWFVRREGGSPRVLLGLSHLWMGVGALALGLWVGFSGLRDIPSYMGPLLGASGFYLIGQMGLFAALERTEASDIAPLLGLKVIVLAALSAVFLGARFSWAQWGSVGLSVAAVLLLWERKGRIPSGVWAAVAVAVVGYSLSDLSIKALVQRLSVLYGARAAIAGVAASYMLSAVIGPFWLGRDIRKRPGVVWAALPFSIFWFMGMIFLYIAFDRAGVVLGNILQSTRGLMAVGLGVLLARMGLDIVESRQAAAVTGRRVAAAATMSAAIALYFF